MNQPKHNRISLATSSFSNRVLTDEQIEYLIRMEDSEAAGPGGAYRNDDELEEDGISEIVRKLSGSTIKEYCIWRWPSQSEEQFLLVLDDLCSSCSPALMFYSEEFAVLNIEDNSALLCLSIRDAKIISGSYKQYIVPIEALS